MNKPELEFFDVEQIPWTPVEGAPPGIWERVLSRDPETGSVTRFLRLDPGARIEGELRHDFWEEVYIIKGGQISGDMILTEGMYACRPPGMLHGPYYAPTGCITFEWRYYDESKR